MVTGNVYHTERDLSIRGRGLPLVFERSYNSRAAADGPLGYGWTHSFNHTLAFSDNNDNGASDAADSDGLTSSVTWTDGSGAQRFIKVTGTAGGVGVGSAFTAPSGFFFQTARQGDGAYTVREKNGLTYTFASLAGTVGQRAALLKIQDRTGNTLTLNYSGSLLASSRTRAATLPCSNMTRRATSPRKSSMTRMAGQKGRDDPGGVMASRAGEII